MSETRIPNHVLNIRLSGKLGANDMQAYRRALQAKTREERNIGMVVDLTELCDISAEGLAAGVQADMAFLSHIEQFYRVAFVSDREWPGVMVGLIQSLFSKPQFRVFVPTERNLAIAWAAQTPATSTASMREPSMRILRSSKDNVMGLVINGAVTVAAVSAVMTELNEFLGAHDKVRLLVRIEHFDGVDSAVLMQSGLLPMKIVAIQKVERYAVVGAPGWMQKSVEAINPVFADIDMRVFARDTEAEAWQWLGATIVE